MKIVRARWAASLVLVAVFVAGCGSSSSSSSTSSSSSAAAAAPTATHSTTTTASGSASGAKAVLISTKSEKKLGMILDAGHRKMTVYLFEADKGGKPTCSGQCAHAWPPVIGNPKAGGGAISSNLGTITRPNGTTQVTYKGHPLYFYGDDKDDGDAYGQGSKAFGAGWYVLKPNGSKLDNT